MLDLGRILVYCFPLSVIAYFPLGCLEVLAFIHHNFVWVDCIIHQMLVCLWWFDQFGPGSSILLHPLLFIFLNLLLIFNFCALKLTNPYLFGPFRFLTGVSWFLLFVFRIYGCFPTLKSWFILLLNLPLFSSQFLGFLRHF